MSQFSVPCNVYRGGTSRGLFFLKKDLPDDVDLRNRIFMTGIDCANPSQVDGLGGATSSTSKVCVLSPSEREGIDVDWTFYQLGVGVAVVDDGGTCGNLMAAVGAFAVDSGLVDVKEGVDTFPLEVFNTNIRKAIHMEVPVTDGKARTSGNFVMPGIATSGAMIRLSILDPGGERTGILQPLGARFGYSRKTGEKFEGTFTDLINPFFFVDAADFDLEGDESPSVISGNSALLAELNGIRDGIAVAAGMASDEEEAARLSPSVPKIAMVASPRSYRTLSGDIVRAEEVDVLVKVLSMGKLHRTSPASGLYNLAATAMLGGTVPHSVSGLPEGKDGGTVRIGHPDGVVEVNVSLSSDGSGVSGVGLDRTARRIMSGDLYVPRSIRHDD